MSDAAFTSNDIEIGVVQGRLVPSPVPDSIQEFPGNRWTDEFSLARSVGCSHIEWILTTACLRKSNNPIMTMSRDDIEFLRSSFDVKIDTVCYDALLTIRDHRRDITLLIERCHALGIKQIVLPFLEEASIMLPSRRDGILLGVPIHDIVNQAKQRNVSLSVETDLPAVDVLRIARYYDVGITFDMGNLAKRGYDLAEHIDVYGELVDNIHVKDCTRGGTTVPLGTGDAGMGNLRHLLETSGLRRVTLQTCRPVRLPEKKPMTNVEWCALNMKAVREWIDDPCRKQA